MTRFEGWLKYKKKNKIAISVLSYASTISWWFGLAFMWLSYSNLAEYNDSPNSIVHQVPFKLVSISCILVIVAGLVSIFCGRRSADPYDSYTKSHNKIDDEEHNQNQTSFIKCLLLVHFPQILAAVFGIIGYALILKTYADLELKMKMEEESNLVDIDRAHKRMHLAAKLHIGEAQDKAAAYGIKAMLLFFLNFWLKYITICLFYFGIIGQRQQQQKRILNESDGTV